MKRVVKKRKQTREKTNKFKILFVIVCVLYFSSSVFLKNHNISLSHELQIIQNENTSIRNANQVLLIRIDELSSFERLSAIAEQHGLKNREGVVRNVEQQGN